MNPVQYITDTIKNYRNQHDAKKVDALSRRMDTIVIAAINRKISQDLSPTERGVDRGYGSSSPVKAKLAKLFGRYLSSNRAAFADNSGYNLQRMTNAYETETFIARVLDQYVTSVLQKGWGFVGNDPSAVNYIQRRLFEMEQVSGITFRTLLEQGVMQQLLYGNVFYTYIRNINASSGVSWTRFDGKQFEPIATLEIQDAVAMRIASDYHKNKPVKYYQNKQTSWGDDGRLIPASGSKKTGRIKKNEAIFEWSPDDVVHIKFHPHAGKVWAMPPMQPVLEDVLALRELEECIQLLVFQYGHILLHGRVEIEDPEAKQQEINNITYQLQTMEGNGAIITGSETSFTAIGAEGKAIRAEAYLHYFQQRVLAGLFTSAVSMGQGDTANRTTADFIDKQKQEVTKDLQAILTDGLQNFFDQLLQEAGKSMDYVWKNRVSLSFPDPDTNSKIKIEQHAMLLYQSNCVTETEMRKMMGMKALEEIERAELYYNQVTIDQSKKQAEVTIATTKATAAAMPPTSPANGPPGTKEPTNSKGNTKAAGASKTAKTTTRPENQHGKKVGPGSIKNQTQYGFMDYLYIDP